MKKKDDRKFEDFLENKIKIWTLIFGRKRKDIQPYVYTTISNNFQYVSWKLNRGIKVGFNNGVRDRKSSVSKVVKFERNKGKVVV